MRSALDSDQFGVFWTTVTPLFYSAISMLCIIPIAQAEKELSVEQLAMNVSGIVPTKPAEILITLPVALGFPAEIYSDGLSMFGNTTHPELGVRASKNKILSRTPVNVLRMTNRQSLTDWIAHGRIDCCGKELDIATS